MNLKHRQKSALALLLILTLSAIVVIIPTAVPIPVVHAQTYPFADYFTLDATSPTPALQPGWSTFSTPFATSTFSLNSSLGALFSLKYAGGAPMTLALDGTATCSMSSSQNTCTASLTTTGTSEFIGVAVSTTSSSRTVSSVTDTGTAGLSFSSRKSATGTSPDTSVYYATTTSALSSEGIKVTMSATGTTTVNVWGVSGANTASPFDPNAAVPASARGSNSVPTVSISTSTANDFIYGVGGLSKSSCSPLTDGSGYTAITSKSSGSSCITTEYKIVSSAQSNLAVNFGSTTGAWVVIADAVQAGTLVSKAVGYGEVTSSSTTLTGSLSFQFSEIKPTTANTVIEVDAFLNSVQSTTAIPTCGSTNHWFKAYLDSSGYAKVDFCNAGTIMNLFTSATSGLVYAVWTMVFSGTKLTNVYLDTGTGSTLAWQNAGQDLGASSVYTYLIGQQSGTTSLQFSFQYYTQTTADGLTATALASSASYLARAYLNIFTAAQSPTGQPMSVMRDLPSVPIEVKDTTTGTWVQAGESGVEVEPWCNLLASLCNALGANTLGTRVLFANSTRQSVQETFAGFLLGVPAGNFVRLQINLSAINPVSQKITIKELTYCPGYTAPICSGDSFDVYMGPYLVFSGNQVGHVWTSYNSHFGFMSNRYVGRHITEVTSRIFGILGYSSQSTYLDNFMKYYVSSTYKDYYDPLSNNDGSYSDNYLWSSDAFPDQSFAHAPPISNSYPFAYPYTSRLTVNLGIGTNCYGAQVWATGGANCPFIGTQTTSYNNEITYGSTSGNPYPLRWYVLPSTDALLADHLAHKFGMSTNATNIHMVNSLITAAGWDGTGVRLQTYLLLWTNNVFIPYPNTSPSYTGYGLATFLGVVSDLYHLSSNSTYLTWAKQAQSVALQTQIPNTSEVEGYTGQLKLPGDIGGLLSSYKYSPSYEYSSNQQGAVSEASSFLAAHGFFDVQPHEWPGPGITNTETTGLSVLAFLNYNADIAAAGSTSGTQSNTNVPQSTQTSSYASGTNGQASGAVSLDDSHVALVNGTYGFAYPPGWFAGLSWNYLALGTSTTALTTTTSISNPNVLVIGRLNSTAYQNHKAITLNNCLGSTWSTCRDGKLSLKVWGQILLGSTVLGTASTTLVAGNNVTGNLLATSFGYFNRTLSFNSLTLSAGTYTFKVGINYSAWGTQQVFVDPLTQVWKAEIAPPPQLQIYTAHTDASSSSYSTANSYQKAFCHANGIFFQFLVDGSTLGWVSSASLSGPWSSLNTITTSGNGGNPVYSSFTCSGTQVFYIIGSNPGVNGQDKIYYRYGTLGGDGSISWAISEGSFSGINSGAYTAYPSTTIATDGTWVAAWNERVNTPTTYYSVQGICVAPYSTCSWPQSTYDLSYGWSSPVIVPTGGTGTAGYIKMDGLGAVGSSGTSQWYGVFNYNYNTGSTTNTYYMWSQNFVYAGSKGIIYGCAVNTASPYDVYFLKYNNSQLSTSSGSGIWTEKDLGISSGNSCGIAASGDGKTINIYYEQSTQNANVYKISSTDGGKTWGSSATISTSENDAAFFTPLNGSEGNNFFGGVSGVAWSNILASPETVRVELG